MSDLLGDSRSIDEIRGGPGPWDHLVVDEPPGEGPRRNEPYSPDNMDAIGVNQRSARHWSGHELRVDGSEATRLLPSQAGRKGFLILVPATAPAGIRIDEQPSVVESGIGFPIVPGASVTVATEGQIYALSATAGTDTVCAVIALWG